MRVFLIAYFVVSTAPATWASCSCENQSESNKNTTSSKGTSPFLTTLQKRVVIKSVKTETINSTPAVMFIGKRGGDILRCLLTDPEECELYYISGSNVLSLHIAGEYLYVGLQSNEILKCTLNLKGSCEKFDKTGSAVDSLTSGDGFLFAGLYNGTVLRCDLQKSKSCEPFHVLVGAVFSVIYFKKNIYFGLDNGHLIRCMLEVTDIGSCKQLFNTRSGIMGLSTVGNSIFAATWDGRLWECTQKSDPVSDYCVAKSLIHKPLRDIVYLNNVFYSLENDGGIYTCQWANDTACATYGNFTNTYSMAIAYSTYEIQRRYGKENTACTWQRKSKCPPFVTYYNEKQRAMLEVYVKDGRLYNSQGYLVDTSEADESHSGPAAIFVMAPDGRLFLSNRHMKELLHSSSLFGGSPVSGAGEMIVKNGVIEKIIACSQHYLPDINLNQQVVESLRIQGYSDPIASLVCSEDNEDRQILTNSCS